MKTALAPGGTVEFWGCNLGSVLGAGESWARLFNAPVRSTFGDMKIGTFSFPGTKSSKDVPKDKKAQTRFRTTLLGWYKTLSKTGEVPVLKTEDDQFAHMRKLFDASGGVIRSRVVTRKSDNQRHSAPATRRRTRCGTPPTPEPLAPAVRLNQPRPAPRDGERS